MAEYMRFTIPDGRDILVDMDQVTTFWEGKTPERLLLELYGADNMIEVVADFRQFVDDWVDYLDIRPVKKKPRKTTRGSLKLDVAKKPV